MFYLCSEKKGADQLCGYHAADLCLYFYTPGIYADGYIVFVFPFVRLYVRSFVRSFVIPSRVKVSHVVYISATTYQKAFIFGP